MGNSNLKGFSYSFKDHNDSFNNTKVNRRVPKRKQKNYNSVKRSYKTQNPRSITKIKPSRTVYNTLKELIDEKTPVMIAFITSSPECQLRLEKKSQKCISEQRNHFYPHEKSFRELNSFPCATFCQKCRQSSILINKRVY